MNTRMDYAVLLFSVLLLFLLCALAWIDIKYFMLPNVINVALLISGALQSIVIGRITLFDATLGSLLGITMLSAVAASFYWRRGYAGLGGGDIKFAGAAGFWVGWQGIPWLLLMASLSGLAFALIPSQRHSRNNLKRRIPFGPFLCGSTFAIWMTQVLY